MYWCMSVKLHTNSLVPFGAADPFTKYPLAHSWAWAQKGSKWAFWEYFCSIPRLGPKKSQNEPSEATFACWSWYGKCNNLSLQVYLDPIICQKEWVANPLSKVLQKRSLANISELSCWDSTMSTAIGENLPERSLCQSARPKACSLCGRIWPRKHTPNRHPKVHSARVYIPRGNKLFPLPRPQTWLEVNGKIVNYSL